MAVTLVATPGAANANSYLTLAEANAYFETRIHTALWDAFGEQEKALMMATRTIDRLAQPFKYLVPAKDAQSAYYKTRPYWTGTPSTSTQALAWPRVGMFDMNGNAIAEDEIPSELKEATAELAQALITADRTLDNDIIVQGISSLKAGSVSLSFKDIIERQVIPDAVWNTMPPSWFNDAVVEPALAAIFERIG